MGPWRCSNNNRIHETLFTERKTKKEKYFLKHYVVRELRIITANFFFLAAKYPLINSLTYYGVLITFKANCWLTRFSPRES